MEEVKRRPDSGIATVIIFFVLLFAFSKWGPRLPISVTSQQNGEPLIVSGVGKVTTSPDIAKLVIGIEESGASLKNVQDSVNTKSKNLTTKLKSLGVPEKNIKTASYYVYPNYDYQNPLPSGGQRINGYRVSTSYEIKVEDFDLVNDILVAAPEVGANTIGNVSFEVNDETKKEKLNEAREIAVKEAKEKAEGLAKASGITLGKIVNISENFGGPVSFREYAVPASVGGDAVKQIAEPDITPGETDLSVTVSLSYEVR